MLQQRTLRGVGDVKRGLAGLAIFGLVGFAPVGSAQASDCEPVVTKIRTFSSGAGALRNTSPGSCVTNGSAKTKSVSVWVQLLCDAPEGRLVSVELLTDSGNGGAPPAVLEAAVSKWMEGGTGAQFSFPVTYDARSCKDGEGPPPRDEGGTTQVSVGAFVFTAIATSDDNGGSDPGLNGDSDAATVDLICKPSRTNGC